MDIDRVLVPVDFSPPSTLAVNHGVALARKLKAQLSLVHVVESGSALVYTFPSEADRVVTQRKEQAGKCAHAARIALSRILATPSRPAHGRRGSCRCCNPRR